MQLRHLFHGRYSSQSACTLLEPGTNTTTQTLFCPHPPPPSPRLESIHCCSRSYYRYAPAKCKTSICHLSARCTMKTSHYAAALPASFTSHGLLVLFQSVLEFFFGEKVWTAGKVTPWSDSNIQQQGLKTFIVVALSFWMVQRKYSSTKTSELLCCSSKRFLHDILIVPRTVTSSGCIVDSSALVNCGILFWKQLSFQILTGFSKVSLNDFLSNLTLIARCSCTKDEHDCFQRHRLTRALKERMVCAALHVSLASCVNLALC